MEQTYIEVKANGLVSAKKGANNRIPYAHQKAAMENLDIIDKESAYSTLVVLPTGAGKTYTASLWLLKHALNRKKKYYGLPIDRCCWIRRQSHFRNMRIRNLYQISTHFDTGLCLVLTSMTERLIY